MSAPADQVFETQKIEVDKPPYVTIEFIDKHGEVYAKHDAIRPYAKKIRLYIPDDECGCKPDVEGHAYSHHLPITAKFTEHKPEEAEDKDVDPPHPSEAKPAAKAAAPASEQKPVAKPEHTEGSGNIALTQPPHT